MTTQDAPENTSKINEQAHSIAENSDVDIFDNRMRSVRENA